MKLTKTILLTVVVSSAVFACTSKTEQATETIEVVQETQPTEPKDFVKGELLVGLTNDADVKAITKQLQENEGVELIKMLMDAKDARIAHFKVPVGKEKEYIEIFAKNPQVEYAELNAIATISPIEATPISSQEVKEETAQPIKPTSTKANVADKIIGVWEVKNDYYMAVYEIQKHKGKYIGLLHYYNDGTNEITGDGSKDYYMIEGLEYKDGSYQNGTMYIDESNSTPLTLTFDGENLIAKMKMQGEDYSETWRRKKN